MTDWPFALVEECCQECGALLDFDEYDFCSFCWENKQQQAMEAQAENFAEQE
jgi:hypothetical protein